MKKLKLFTEYCTGCGLCKSVRGTAFNVNDKGYIEPILNKKDEAFCAKVCPASGHALKKYQDGTIWGTYKSCNLGWSADEKIRKGSSSGGVLTSICCYLLEKGIVDGIIQTRRANDDIRKTETVISYTKEDVMSCMGSRYTTSSPLMNLVELLREGKKYAFVGKPCDVSALRIFMNEENQKIQEMVKYLFSFFCAGMPSIDANNRLVKALGGERLSDCKDLQYRGNGWPGYATLTMKDGSKQQMDYETSWMTILGRDVRKICRFCADGTGELADISCGDAWYLGCNGKPDFTERPGRNVIFARTEAGASLLRETELAGCVDLETFDPNKDQLRKIQPYHYTRKASLIVYKWALRACGRVCPNYDNKKLRYFAKGFPLKQKAFRFIGTVKRVLKGKI